ncbi:MAG TPA: HAD-IIIC family phosphatase [Planktothrix sp.]|jgi:FkbH-like protein
MTEIVTSGIHANAFGAQLSSPMDVTALCSDEQLKTLLKNGDAHFWGALKRRSETASDFTEAFFLSNLRKKGLAMRGAPALQTTPLRIAMIGSYSFYPLREIFEHMLFALGISCDLWVGEFDNYMQEILDGESRLYAFAPDVVIVWPGDQRFVFDGNLSSARADVVAHANESAAQIHRICNMLHEKSKAEVILTNFMLPGQFDPGPLRTRAAGSDWSYKKMLNLELGLCAPPFVHICDLEFLAYRRGAHAASDLRGWFQSKQPCSPDLATDISREFAHLCANLKSAHKKVLVMDLDNTLWGGVIGDDGLRGIEIGDTSALGQSFKAFQKYILALSQRGILLAVCSKNDEERAMEPFDSHPEMVLRREHIVNFKANWRPKSDNIRQIAAELSLGLQHFVFVDDNPAEIEIVNQFLPEVTTILLGDDPAFYVQQLADSRLFEPKQITEEDYLRTQQYRAQGERQLVLESSTNMSEYLRSLNMVISFDEFGPLNQARIAQLIGKSNQFNLTTHRRSEGDIASLIDDPQYVGFSARLSDRFGDHGLISVFIGRFVDLFDAPTLEIDTLLMSCRVLNRQVEHEVMNEIVRIAKSRACHRVLGVYKPSPQNSMVANFYPSMGFIPLEGSHYKLNPNEFEPFLTPLEISRRSHEPS